MNSHSCTLGQPAVTVTGPAGTPPSTGVWTVADVLLWPLRSRGDAVTWVLAAHLVMSQRLEGKIEAFGWVIKWVQSVMERDGAPCGPNGCLRLFILSSVICWGCSSWMASGTSISLGSHRKLCCWVGHGILYAALIGGWPAGERKPGNSGQVRRVESRVGNLDSFPDGVQEKTPRFGSKKT